MAGHADLVPVCQLATGPASHSEDGHVSNERTRPHGSMNPSMRSTLSNQLTNAAPRAAMLPNGWIQPVR
jgi:hypothetical protein